MMVSTFPPALAAFATASPAGQLIFEQLERLSASDREAAAALDDKTRAWASVYEMIVEQDARHELALARSETAEANFWPVVLKFMLPSIEGDAEQIERFQGKGYVFPAAAEFRATLEDARAAVNPNVTLTPGMAGLADAALEALARGETDEWE